MKPQTKTLKAKIILIAISQLLLLSTVLSSCSLPHEHSFGEWEEYRAANCVDNGSERRYCKCGEEQIRSIDAKGHTINEGACIDCKKIFDPYKAFVQIIKTEGKADESNGYTFPKESYITDDSKTFVSYDSDSREMQVIFASEYVVLSVTIDPSDSTNEVFMVFLLNSENTYISKGYIYTSTFDIYKSTVHGFSCNAPSPLDISLEELITSSTRLAIYNFSEILNQADVGITIQMLGFESIK